MLEDLEPWPDLPGPGEVCAPTTYWASPDDMDLPVEVCAEIDARIEAVTVDGRAERIAHLGHGGSPPCCAAATQLPAIRRCGAA